MRKFLITTGLMLVLAALVVAPALAQRRPGGGGFGGFGGGDPLSNPAVQKALKMTDDQIKEAGEIRRKANEEAAKKIEAKLTSEQKKRYGEIQLWMAEIGQDLKIFTKDGTVKALSLTDKQVKAVKDAMTDMEKDLKELREEAKGDFRKIFTKSRELRKEAWDKFTGTFTAAQKKAWETAKGEKFEMPRFGGGGGGGRPKKDSKKKDEI
jgi:Spy/CpxP family protein refolding chaperone